MASSGNGRGGARAGGRTTIALGRADVAVAPEREPAVVDRQFLTGALPDDALPDDALPDAAQPDAAHAVALVTVEHGSVPVTARMIARLALYALSIIGLGALTGLVVGGRGAKVYAARADVRYQLTATQPTGFLRQDRNLTTQIILMTARGLLEPIANGAGMTVEDLSRELSVSTVSDSEIIRAEVHDQSKDRAIRLAQAVTSQYLTAAKSSAPAAEQTYLQDKISSIDTRRAAIESERSKLEADRIAEAAGLARVVSGAVIGPASITVLTPSAAFSAVDVGRMVTVIGAGPGGRDLVTTIALYVSPTQVNLATASGNTEALKTATVKIANVNRVDATVSAPGVRETQLAAEDQSMIDQRRDLSGRLDDVMIAKLDAPVVEAVGAPYLLTDPVSPRPEFAAAAGAIAALPVGLFVAALLGRRRSARTARS